MLLAGFLQQACIREKSYEYVDPLSLPSNFTLENTCTGAIITGTYRVGDSLDATNSIELTVDVKQPGRYKIITKQSLGMIFSDSGVFTTKGAQKLLLKGSGIPTNAGSYNIVLQYGGSSCSVAIPVLPFEKVVSCGGDYRVNHLPDAFQFVYNNTVYKGPIDSAYIVYTADETQLLIVRNGEMGRGGFPPRFTFNVSRDSAFGIGMLLPWLPIQKGMQFNTHKRRENDNLADFFFLHKDGAKRFFRSTIGNPFNAEMYYRVESYDRSTCIMELSFYGTPMTNDGSFVSLNGRCKVKIAY